MKCPRDKAVGYTAVVIVCAIVLAIVVSAIAGLIAGAGMLASGMAGGRVAGSVASPPDFEAAPASLNSSKREATTNTRVEE